MTLRYLVTMDFAALCTAIKEFIVILDHPLRLEDSAAITTIVHTIITASATITIVVVGFIKLMMKRDLYLSNFLVSSFAFKLIFELSQRAFFFLF